MDSRRHGNAATVRVWIESDREPIAATPRKSRDDVRLVDDRHRHNGTASPRRRREPDLVGAVDAAATWMGTGYATDRADRLEVTGEPVREPCEVDHVDEPRPELDESSAIRSGDRRRPTPDAAPGSTRRANDPSARSIAGITSTGRIRLSRHQQPPMEADRQRPVAEQRVVECLEAERLAEAALLVARS